MASDPRSSGLTGLARSGFTELSTAARELTELVAATGLEREMLVTAAGSAADPDGALRSLLRIAWRDPQAVREACGSPERVLGLWRILGASEGFAEFALRHPAELASLADVPEQLPSAAASRSALLTAVGAVDGFAESGDESAWIALRVAYRRVLGQIASYDLASPDPLAAVSDVAAALADAAAAALEASLAVARTHASNGGPGSFPRQAVAATRLAVVGMGKTGARELNYVSDVDVIYVADTAAPEILPESRAIDIATRLARLMTQGVAGVAIEPALWEVDANLRPEGKQGALVRSLDSHLSYYERWAKGWEFQALLKARPIAGDLALGAEYVAALAPKVWESAAREHFVENVQRMRERVMEYIPAEDVPYQLKLGPGGLRDIEFTVQLLQLVHGLSDDQIRQRGTLAALSALIDAGYIGRTDGAVFERDYRVLRVLEHRLQLRQLRRTHLMPRTPEELRMLARSSALAESGARLTQLWERTRHEVREVHVRVFYRPLLSAVAALPAEERVLSAEQAHDRLAAIGFRDPAGALRHIGALTSGLSRRSTIQRHLMPVMLRWFSEGADPDMGLLSFRRVAEKLGDTSWFLRMLRDSSAAAERLTQVLSSSRYAGELMERIPESVRWLDASDQLQPRSAQALLDEARAIQDRHETTDAAMKSVRALRRREMLRTALGALLGVLDVHQIATALTTITDATIQATLRAVAREVLPESAAELDFSVIAMGRYGGAELGFGSDADVIYVFDPQGIDPHGATTLALRIVTELRRLSDDPKLPLELDADLRPEGKNGPMARSLAAYREYYTRWSKPWEAQALLRGRGSAGSRKLIERFTQLADGVRYPDGGIDLQTVREIKRIKARVESERLPQGADRSRHLKLGPGGLSDVEWLVQLWQLQYGHDTPELRTTSTLQALIAATDAGLATTDQADTLRAAWVLASRLRSANTLLTGRTSDVLPTDRRALDGIGRILGYPPRSATAVEEDFLAAARRARRVFDKLFYG